VGYRQYTLSTFIFIAELQTAKTNHVPCTSFCN